MPNTSISFPANPAVNQQYTYGTTTYVWTGTSWMTYIDSPSLIPINSSFVSYSPAAQGASQRTVLDKLRDQFNIMDYVQGDWVPNNDTKDFTPTFAAAIAAVAAAGGGVLEFVGSDNYYFLTRPPELTGGVCLEGNRCIIYKKYIETGSGTYAGAEGQKRGVFSLDGNTNNLTFIRNFSIINDGWDGSDNTGNGSAISIVADAGDSNGPGLIWISNIHSTATGTGLAAPANYKWWKCNLFIDGSERRSAPIGVRGVYVTNCVFFTASVASIEAYAALHLFVNGTEGSVNRSGAVGVKCDGGTKSGGVGAQSDRPIFTGCDFQSVFGYKFGTESSVTHSYVQSPIVEGTIGQLELGAQCLSPFLIGSQTNALTVDPAVNYTLITENGSHLHGDVAIAGNVDIGGTLATTGNATVGGNETITGDLAVNGGDITTAAATATVFNSAATTLNIGGAATTVNLGAAAGTVSVDKLSMNAGYGSIAPVYGCRAWVNFNGTQQANLSATYSQNGTTVTVTTSSAHGQLTGQQIYNVFVSSTSGTPLVTGLYTITVTGATTFTYPLGTAAGTGSCTLRRALIKASGNVSSVTDSGTGDFYINFAAAMPDANYAAILSVPGPSNTGVNTYPSAIPSNSQLTHSCRVITVDVTNVDRDNTVVMVFR